jgi:hypothetical protein
VSALKLSVPRAKMLAEAILSQDRFQPRNNMDPKPRPNHALYIEVLRRMTPAQRLAKAFELSDFARNLFIHGLRKRFPNATEEEFKRILLERLRLCHNKNY